MNIEDWDINDDTIADEIFVSNADLVVAKRKRPYKYAWAVLGVLLIVLLILWLMRPKPETLAGEYVSAPSNNSALTTYRKALAETDTGIRLFRLQDLIELHPDTREASYAKLQIDVLSEHEERDWQKVDIVFSDKRSSTADRLAAISAYQDPWQDVARGTDIAERLETLQEDETAEAPRLSVKLEETSPFAQDSAPVSGPVELAGGPVIITFKPEPRPYIPAPIETLAVPNLVEARIRRSESPRYPKKALRRGIEATVILSLDISDSGKVTDTRLVSINADRYERDFIKEAERAAKRTKFYPEKRNGKAVASKEFLRQFTFRLDE